MKTETQLTAEIYNALNSIVSLFWLSRPTLNQTFPLAVYKNLDISSEYAFGISRSAEERIYQIDLYVSPEQVVIADNLIDSIKTAMEGLNYRLTGSQADFIDSELNKIIKVTRWERFNV